MPLKFFTFFLLVCTTFRRSPGPNTFCQPRKHRHLFTDTVSPSPSTFSQPHRHRKTHSVHHTNVAVSSLELSPAPSMLPSFSSILSNPKHAHTTPNAQPFLIQHSLSSPVNCPDSSSALQAMSLFLLPSSLRHSLKLIG